MSDSESRGWASSEDVVVGTPSPAFEARLVKPEFDSSLYRPDTAIDGWSNGRVVVRAASVRGYQHRYDGSPRQDDFALLASDDGRMVFLAVADGLSSARNSHIGSSYATRYAVRWLNQSVASNAKETDGGRIDWERMLSDCIRSTSWFLLQETARLFGVEKDVSSAARVTATTLVCAAVVTEDDRISVYSVSVGDSGVWLLADSEFIPLSGGKSPDADGITDSSVQHFLPGGIPETFDVAHHDLAAGSVLLLGSDGFGDPLGSGRGAVGDLFRETFEGRIPSRHEFAHVLDFQRETFDDDRTLVGVWTGSGDEVISASSKPCQQAPRHRHRAVESPARPAPPDGEPPKEQGDPRSMVELQGQADPPSSGARPSATPSFSDAQAGPRPHGGPTLAPRDGMKPAPTGTAGYVSRSGTPSKRSRASVVEMVVVAVIAMILGLIGGRYIGQSDQRELPEPVGPVPDEVPSGATTSTVHATTSSVPATTSSVPATTSSVPATTTSVQATTSTVHATTSSVPATTSSVPATTSSVPATTSSVPATTTSVQATTSTVPATTSSVLPSTTTSVVLRVPDAPSLSLSLAGKVVTASWNSPYDGGTPIEGFRLEYIGPQYQYEVGTNPQARKYNFPDVPCGLDVSIGLVAFNSEGEGTQSLKRIRTGDCPVSDPLSSSLALDRVMVAATWKNTLNGGAFIGTSRTDRQNLWVQLQNCLSWCQ